MACRSSFRANRNICKAKRHDKPAHEIDYLHLNCNVGTIHTMYQPVKIQVDIAEFRMEPIMFSNTPSIEA